MKKNKYGITQGLNDSGGPYQHVYICIALHFFCSPVCFQYVLVGAIFLEMQSAATVTPIHIYIYIYIYIYICIYICGAFNKFPDFFVQAFKIVVDSWKLSMLLLYILWDDWSIFMISGSNEQLQQQLEYTLLKPDCHSW